MKNEVINEHSKHIDVRNHFIRDHVEKGNIILNYFPTDLMVAAAFTKPLEQVKLMQHVAAMGLH